MPVQSERRHLWRMHNSLRRTRPLIFVRAFAWPEMPEAHFLCANPFLRRYEDILRSRLFWDGLDDDSIFEPRLTLPAVHRCTGWGIAGERRTSGEARGLFKIDYPIREPEDFAKMRPPRHEIDEEETARQADRLREELGGVLEVDARRCAEQIGADYVPSYRPSPADMVSHGFDEGRIRSILTRDLTACRECHVDITLKDVETVQTDPDRVRRWVALTRRVSRRRTRTPRRRRSPSCQHLPRCHW